MINYHYNGIVPSVTASWSSYYAVNGYHIATSTSTSSQSQAAATSANSTSTITPTSTPVLSGLSSGAKAGIGVGVAVVVLAALASLLFICFRRQRRKRQRMPAPNVVDPVELPEEVPLTSKRYLKSELSGGTAPIELDARPQEKTKLNELHS